MVCRQLAQTAQNQLGHISGLRFRDFVHGIAVGKLFQAVVQSADQALFNALIVLAQILALQAALGVLRVQPMRGGKNGLPGLQVASR